MMLMRKYYAPETLLGVLKEYRPFPKYGEENPLTAEQKARMIKAGEEYLGYQWPVALATDYMKYVTEGSRKPYEGTNYNLRRAALGCLVDAEYAEQKGRFIPDIINGVWAIMDEAYWVVPAHNDNRMLPDFDQPIFVDLFSAGTAGLLTNVYYLLKKPIDAVSPLVLRRMEKVMEERIMKPFMTNLYWWSGLAGRDTCNWGPWIISNVLTVFAVFCKDEARKASAVSFACLQLDQFIKLYGADGGCDEGPSYWGHAAASLFDCLCILCDMSGDAFAEYFDEPLIQNLGTYICHANVAGGQFTNYEDAHFHFRVSYDLVYRFGKKIHSEMMEQMGIALYRLYTKEDNGAPVMRPGVHAHYRYMRELLSFPELNAAGEGRFPLEESAWLADLEMIAERQTGGSEEGLYLSAKAGMNNISHNHNDIGGFMLFSDGKPAIVDIGSGLYNAKTFSAQRYEIPQMQSSYHNLPEINGKMQMDGPQYKSRNVSHKTENGVTAFSLDIADPYVDAGVETWQRTFLFDRGTNTLTVKDEAAFAAEKNHADTMFIVPTQPVVDGNAVTVPVEGGRDVVIVGEGVTFTAERFDVSYDKNLNTQWNGAVWRIKAAADAGTALQQTFTITQK